MMLTVSALLCAVLAVAPQDYPHQVYLPHVARQTCVYSGPFVHGWERSSLAADDNELPWWVWGGPAYGELLDRYYAIASPYQPVNIVVKGVRSQPGRWGHLGYYYRQLSVTAVFSVSVVVPFKPR